MYFVDIKLLKIPSYRLVGDKDIILILIIVKSFCLSDVFMFILLNVFWRIDLEHVWNKAEYETV